MKKTIAAILVAVIAGLASPGAFGTSIRTSAPTGLSIQAAGAAKKEGDTIVKDIAAFFSNVGTELRSIFSKIF
jgi:spore maturation protein SpmB